MNIDKLKSGITQFANMKIVLVLIPIITICIVCFGLYMLYNKILEIQEREPVFIRKIQNAKKPHHISGERVGLPTNGFSYTFMIWLNITDWEYRRNEWKHVFHKGSQNGGDSQPGVWINPKSNDLTIRFNTRAGKMVYTINPGFPEYLRIVFEDLDDIAKKTSADSENLVEAAARTFMIFNEKYKGNLVLVENSKEKNTYKEIKKMYPSAISLIIITRKNGGELTDDTVPFRYIVINKRTELQNLNLSIAPADDFPGAKYLGIFTIEKSTNLPSLSPEAKTQIDNVEEVSNNVYNVPLNRWFHLAITGNSLNTSTYIDGHLYNSKPMGSFLQDNNGDLFVTQNGGFGGALTQLRYYNRALTVKEIYYRARMGPDCFTFPDLKAMFSKYKLPKFKVKLDLEVNGVDIDEKIKKAVNDGVNYVDNKVTGALDGVDNL